MSKSQPKADADGEEDGEVPDGERDLDHLKNEDLGDDVFAVAKDAPVGVESGNEAWLGTTREYTYNEVSFVLSSLQASSLMIRCWFSCSRGSTTPSTLLTRRFCLRHRRSDTPSHHRRSTERVTKSLSSRTLRISASGCTDRCVSVSLLARCRRFHLALSPRLL